MDLLHIKIMRLLGEALLVAVIFVVFKLFLGGHQYG